MAKISSIKDMQRENLKRKSIEEKARTAACRVMEGMRKNRHIKNSTN